MKPLDLSLHGLSLSCSVALAAGLWSVSRSEAPLAAAPVAAAPAPSPVLTGELRQLQDAVASLRLEVAQLRETRDGTAAPVPEASAAATIPGTESTAALQTALDDPKVQEKLQAIVTARLEADREAESRQRAERWREEEQRRAEQRLDAFARKAGLNDAQKAMLGKLASDFHKQADTLRAQVREKALTPEQAKEAGLRAFDEMDKQVQSALSADQYAQYQDSLKRLREMAMHWVPSGDAGGRRGR